MEIVYVIIGIAALLAVYFLFLKKPEEKQLPAPGEKKLPAARDKKSERPEPASRREARREEKAAGKADGSRKSRSRGRRRAGDRRRGSALGPASPLARPRARRAEPAQGPGEVARRRRFFRPAQGAVCRSPRDQPRDRREHRRGPAELRRRSADHPGDPGASAADAQRQRSGGLRSGLGSAARRGAADPLGRGKSRRFRAAGKADGGAHGRRQRRRQDDDHRQACDQAPGRRAESACSPPATPSAPRRFSS